MERRSLLSSQATDCAGTDHFADDRIGHAQHRTVAPRRSPGGSPFSAEKLALRIRQNHLATVVPNNATCASACFLAKCRHIEHRQLLQLAVKLLTSSRMRFSGPKFLSMGRPRPSSNSLRMSQIPN
jgi:hypothetical protein